MLIGQLYGFFWEGPRRGIEITLIKFYSNHNYNDGGGIDNLLKKKFNFMCHHHVLITSISLFLFMLHVLVNYLYLY